MWVTNSAAGGEHGLRIRVFGEHGGAGVAPGGPEPPAAIAASAALPQIMTRGRPGLSAAAQRATRVALGHPEGYFEAFANLYADAAEAIVARRTGEPPDPLALDFPTVEDGARGVKFVEAAVESSRDGGRWTDCRAGAALSPALDGPRARPGVPEHVDPCATRATWDWCCWPCGVMLGDKVAKLARGQSGSLTMPADCSRTPPHVSGISAIYGGSTQAGTDETAESRPGAQRKILLN